MPVILTSGVLFGSQHVGDSENDIELVQASSSTSYGVLSASTTAFDHRDTSTDAADANPLHSYDGNIGNGDETVSAGTNYKYQCETQPDGCAEVRVGWDGQIQRWERGSSLKYVICEESFPTKDSATLVKTALSQATSEWKGIGARFEEVNRHEQATFAVVYDGKMRRGCCANSFFPQSSKCELIVCPMIFEGSNNAHVANILTHEVGHILGLRHEFAQKKEAGYHSVCFGSEDAQSAMNYHSDPSNFRVSQLDLEGLQEVYTYDKSTYMGLPVVDVSPKLYTFDEGDSTTTRRKNRPAGTFSESCRVGCFDGLLLYLATALGLCSK